jgi:acetyl-CoA acetyltransferase
LYGDTEADFTGGKVKNAANCGSNPCARSRTACTAEEVDASPLVADPLRLLHITATSDGGAALVVSSLDYAKKIGRGDAVRVAAISTVTPQFASASVEMPDIATDSAAAAMVDAVSYRSTIATKAYEEAGVDPKDISMAEVYDLSSALELDWMEDLQLCERGEAATLLRNGETQNGGRIPVNASGGLACFR